MYITVRFCTKLENNSERQSASSAEVCAGFKFGVRCESAGVLVKIGNVLPICRSAARSGRETAPIASHVAFNAHQRPPNELYRHHASMFFRRSGRIACGKVADAGGVSVAMPARWSILWIRSHVASMIPEARVMEDALNRPTFRPRAELRPAPIDRPSASAERPIDRTTERPSASEDLSESPESAPETPAPSARRRKQNQTTNEFTGSLVPVQFKLPADLAQSLKLHAIDTGETMSEIVLRCLTTGDTVAKAWISTRKAG